MIKRLLSQVPYFLNENMLEMLKIQFKCRPVCAIVHCRLLSILSPFLITNPCLHVSIKTTQRRNKIVNPRKLRFSFPVLRLYMMACCNLHAFGSKLKSSLWRGDTVQFSLRWSEAC